MHQLWGVLLSPACRWAVPAGLESGKGDEERSEEHDIFLALLVGGPS